MENCKKIGESGYLNTNCWLTKTLNYSPGERCRYCDLKFHHCLFFQYLIIILISLSFFIILSFLIEEKISKLAIIFIFALIIIYGYFFNRSTDNLIKLNFAQRKTNEELEELTKTLEKRVRERTKKLQESYEKLKILNRTKSEFISMASHQLRTPLSAIKGYISMIIEGTYGELPPKIKERMENVFHSNERLIKIINDLLSISKIELGKMELEKTPIQIEDLVQSCYNEMEIEAKKKGLKFIFEKPEIPLPKIELDSLKIRQVILNLIDNAIKYTQQGEINLKLVKTNSSILFLVKDTGGGLTKEEEKDIFEGFTRGSAGLNFFIEGAGLGLYVAKKFLELHNGKIWAESQGKNKGSTFCLELPLK